ncbi:MAG: ParB/RepB/Spo0J family partition protein [Planctomycetes bacterium]|nr:ParB/RepB/Spo0J family partition protein [Planctomycetota bacterium]
MATTTRKRKRKGTESTETKPAAAGPAVVGLVNGRKAWRCDVCGAAWPEDRPSCLTDGGKCPGMRPGLLPLELAMLAALEPAPGETLKWAELAERGASDEEIGEFVRIVLNAQGVGVAYSGEGALWWNGTCISGGRWLSLWFEPEIGDRRGVHPDERDPEPPADLEGDAVIAAVRGLFAIPPAAAGSQPSNGQAAKSGAKTSRKTSRGKVMGAATVAAGAVWLPVELIDPSPYQPRRHFDEAKLKSLGKSLRDDGQAQACQVRPKPDGRYELIEGERRLRAVKLEGLPTLKCDIEEIDDATAIRRCGAANLEREQLNKIEEIRWYRTLLDHGVFPKQKDLAKKLGIKEASLSNLLRLLDLPQATQDLISQEKLTATAARYLVPFKDRPAVLDRVAKSLASYRRPAGVEDAKHEIGQALRSVARPLEGWGYAERKGRRDWIEVALSKTDRDRADLDVVEFDREKFAMNVKLWEELQAKGEARRKKAQSSRGSKAGGGRVVNVDSAADDAAARREKVKQKREQWQKKLYRWKLRWLQERSVERLAQAGPEIVLKLVAFFALRPGHTERAISLRSIVTAAGGKTPSRKAGTWLNELDSWAALSSIEPKQLPSLAVEALSVWLRHDFERSSADVRPADIERISGELGVDLQRDWKLSRDYLELYTTESLHGLAKEWSLEGWLLGRPKRADVIDGILSANGQIEKKVRCPRELLQLKAVRL